MFGVNSNNLLADYGNYLCCVHKPGELAVYKRENSNWKPKCTITRQDLVSIHFSSLFRGTYRDSCIFYGLSKTGEVHEITLDIGNGTCTTSSQQVNNVYLSSNIAGEIVYAENNDVYSHSRSNSYRTKISSLPPGVTANKLLSLEICDNSISYFSKSFLLVALTKDGNLWCKQKQEEKWSSIGKNVFSAFIGVRRIIYQLNGSESYKFYDLRKKKPNDFRDKYKNLTYIGANCSNYKASLNYEIWLDKEKAIVYFRSSIPLEFANVQTTMREAKVQMLCKKQLVYVIAKDAHLFALCKDGSVLTGNFHLDFRKVTGCITKDVMMQVIPGLKIDWKEYLKQGIRLYPMSSPMEHNGWASKDLAERQQYLSEELGKKYYIDIKIGSSRITMPRIFANNKDWK